MATNLRGPGYDLKTGPTLVRRQRLLPFSCAPFSEFFPLLANPAPKGQSATQMLMLTSKITVELSHRRIKVAPNNYG